MKTFPMFLCVADRPVVIVGGGEQAAQKCRLMLKTEARIIVAWPHLEAELESLAREGKISWHSGAISRALFDDAALIFIATGCPGSAAAIQGLTRSSGAVVNVVDQPDLCTAMTPSLVDRDPVVVAIGTEGTAPMLARKIKSQIETMLEPQLGGLAALAGRLRNAVARSVPKNGRRAFWRWVFEESPRRLHAKGAEREAALALKTAMAAGGAPDHNGRGTICLVGAGPGSADLLTLRAMQRLQEADVIFYDRLVDPAVLELARRDAERVYVGKQVGANQWPQKNIDQVIVAAALSGKSVVRLKSGDPMIFGRAEEELEAARNAGIPVEIVPGVTAAIASAAVLGRSLTERGKTDRVVFATGTCKSGDPSPDISDLLQPGTTVVLYMAVNATPRFSRQLKQQGFASDFEIDIVCSASRLDQRALRTTLGKLEDTIERENVQNPSIFVLRAPKLHAITNGIEPCQLNHTASLPLIA